MWTGPPSLVGCQLCLESYRSDGVCGLRWLADSCPPFKDVTAGLVLQEMRGWGGRACVFSSCSVHVSPDPLLLTFLFWYCLWVPVVSCACPNDAWWRQTTDALSVLLTGFILHTVLYINIYNAFFRLHYTLSAFSLSAFSQWGHKWTENVLLFGWLFIATVEDDFRLLKKPWSCIRQVIELALFLNRQLVKYLSIWVTSDDQRSRSFCAVLTCPVWCIMTESAAVCMGGGGINLFIVYIQISFLLFLKLCHRNVDITVYRK